MAAVETTNMVEAEQLLDDGSAADLTDIVDFSRGLHAIQSTKLILRVAAAGLSVCLVFVLLNQRILRVGIPQRSGADDSHSPDAPESANLEKLLVKAEAPAKIDTFILASRGKFCNAKEGRLFLGEDRFLDVDRACEERCRQTLGCNYYMVSGSWCQLSNSCLSTSTRQNASLYMRTNITRVLFVGDSLTYVESLPGQLVTVAASLGRRLEVATYSMGGCSLLAQTAKYNGGVNKLMGLENGEYEWDYIVLQEHSMLPTVKSLRDAYFTPAVDIFAHEKGPAKIVLHLPESFSTGDPGFCRPPSKAANSTKCWPLGHITDYLEPLCKSNTKDYLKGIPCMTYANLRGAMETASQTGADLISPGGLAWMVASGWSFHGEIDTCKAAIDKEYSTPFEVEMKPANLNLAYLKLYMKENRRTSRLGTLVHPSRLGQYLNALTLYATLFGSPVGSTAQPTCWSHCYGDDWHREPPGIFKSKMPRSDLKKLQQLAVETVDWLKVAQLWAQMNDS